MEEVIISGAGMYTVCGVVRRNPRSAFISETIIHVVFMRASLHGRDGSIVSVLHYHLAAPGSRLAWYRKFSPRFLFSFQCQNTRHPG